MTKRILDYDPVTGTTQWFHYDSAADRYALETTQDVTKIVERNKALFRQVDERRSEERRVGKECRSRWSLKS